MPEFLKKRSHTLLLAIGVLVLVVVLAQRAETPHISENIKQVHPTKDQKIRQDIVQSFAPHKALYEIRLVSKRSGSQIVNIAGQMLYDWHPSCDAWLSNHRFNMIYEYADSAPMRIISNFSTFESFDGSSLSYSSQRKRNGEIFEELRGEAVIDTSKKQGRANFTVPQTLSFDLDAGTLFPMAHTAEVARQIKKGQPFYSAVIFDGSDEKGPIEVNSFIGKPVDVADQYKDHQDFDVSLVQSPAHKVRLAFFPLESDQATADYEMDLVFHENGVISDMAIEYEDFSITQKLVALEQVEDRCEAPQKEPPKNEENQ